MERVLFISYYFPPVGGAGVQRSQKFCKYLPEQGILPVVLAGPAVGQGRWEPIDDRLASEIPGDVQVFRPDNAPKNVSTSRWERLLGRPAARYRWWSRALLDLGARVIRQTRPSAIYITLSPFEGLEPAVALAEAFDLPLLADLRDPWALDEVRIYPTHLHRRFEFARMARLLRSCQCVLWNTPEALSVARAALPDLESRFFSLGNGFDASDFEGLSLRPPDGRFRIVHTGYLHTQLGGFSPASLLGGNVWPIDHRGRSHYYLIRALERLGTIAPTLLERLDVQLVGATSTADDALIADCSVGHVFQANGYLDHASTVAAQVSADLLFLPMHGLPPGCRSRIIPAKTYEYLASRRPILAAVPEGDVRDLVLSTSAGRVVGPTDVRAMAYAIQEFAQEAPAPSRELDARMLAFDRRAQTRVLASHLRQILGHGEGAPR